MPNPLLIMDHANMFCGGQNDKNSNHLTLMQVQFPTMNIQYVDHRPGGAPVAIEIDTIMARFEVKFQCVGITPQIWRMLLRFEAGANEFWIYGNIREQMTGTTFQAAAFVEGQLAAVEPTPFKRGEVLSTNYAVRGIRRYRFFLGDKILYDWDFFTNLWAVDGFNQDGANTEGLGSESGF